MARTFTDALGFLVRYLVQQAYSLPDNSVRPANQKVPTGAEGDEFATVLVTSSDSDFGSLTRSYAAPVSPSWAPTGSLTTSRWYHKATTIPPNSLHPSGSVLVTGGLSNGVVQTSVELLDLATGLWSSAGNMSSGRYYHTASLLAPTSGHPMGAVLIAGGANSSGSSEATAEIYDVATNTISLTTNNMSNRRWLHTATVLQNGNVLLIGGEDYYGGSTFEATADNLQPSKRAVRTDR